METPEDKKVNALIKNDSARVNAEEIIDILKGKVYHIWPKNPVVHKPIMNWEEALIRLNHIPKQIITEDVDEKYHWEHEWNKRDEWRRRLVCCVCIRKNDSWFPLIKTLWIIIIKINYQANHGQLACLIQ